MAHCTREKTLLFCWCMWVAEVDEPAMQRRNHHEDKQNRTYDESQKGEKRIHADHHQKHADKKCKRTQHREKTVHREGLDCVGIRGQPIEQVADLTAVMKRKRKALDMAVEVATQIVDHILPDSDRRIIVEDAQPSEEQINNDQTRACEQEKVL